MIDSTSSQTLVPDLNIGELVDQSNGQIIGGSGDIGTAIANYQTLIELGLALLVVYVLYRVLR